MRGGGQAKQERRLFRHVDLERVDPERHRPARLDAVQSLDDDVARLHDFYRAGVGQRGFDALENRGARQFGAAEKSPAAAAQHANPKAGVAALGERLQPRVAGPRNLGARLAEPDIDIIRAGAAGGDDRDVREVEQGGVIEPEVFAGGVGMWRGQASLRGSRPLKS